MRAVDVDEVATLVDEVAMHVVLPRWRRTLAAGEAEEKSPGEVVTSVDRERPY
jgi:hypothetical protein